MQRKGLFRLLRSGWIGLLLFALVGAVLFAPTATAEPAAERLGQTVPVPTATEAPSAPPTATPNPGSGDDDDDDDDAGDTDQQEQGAVLGVSAGDQLRAQVETSTLSVRVDPAIDAAELGILGIGDLVDLLERTEDGAWYLICCIGEGDAGWISAQFVNPLGISRAGAEQLLPVLAEKTEGNAAAPDSLSVTIEQLTPFAKQGDTVELLYTIVNAGSDDAQDVMLRNDLPGGLVFVEANAGDGIVAEPTNESGVASLSAQWDVLPAGEETTLMLIVELDTSLADGIMIDNLASVEAANGDSANAGVSIGLPPSSLPTFQ